MLEHLCYLSTDTFLHTLKDIGSIPLHPWDLSLGGLHVVCVHLARG